MIKVGIVGATGYTGVELLRLLALRDDVRIDVVTSRELEGTSVADLFPNLRGYLDIRFTVPDDDALAACDVVFYATPHTVAMKSAASLMARGVRIIDLSADFRLKDRELWEKWYKEEHESPELIEKAVYGLPEVNRAAIRDAQLIAVPGCYPTAVQLGLIPLLEKGLVDPAHLIADAKSGVSGAGRGAKVGSLLCEASESMSAYGVAGHRHLPEISQGLRNAAGTDVNLTFIPHLTPMIRGIHATLYARPTSEVTAQQLQSLFEDRYRDEPFVDVMPAGSHPATRNVKGSNRCQIAVHYLADSDTIVVLSVIDNLVKGASGQAVQNMNIMFGLSERSGLDTLSLLL
ncbi:N-acetyl-gamma-glutamyl-phosphate reductase [Pseudohongiella sp. O18]|uniref:N-acetyl-gamma-glutamyl-phosphate reductase n=1 Tax=Pseudohongiella sp. O18 TaxID=2904248 RepID=UPI001F0057B5|nr:N-acetyl-gamma-glutamyl-phosphate reductase [Pseudohongiella sp. O18]